MIDHKIKNKIFSEFENKIKELNFEIVELDFINFKILIPVNMCLHLHHFYRNNYGNEIYSITCDVFNFQTKTQLSVNLLYDNDMNNFSGLKSLQEIINIVKESAD